MGIVHRDIKPSNILLDESGNAYLSDFGIAKNLEADRQLTAAGAILGSPDYMSPEQLLDEKVGPKSDLYSLGAVIFETLTGEKPYGDSSVANLIYKQIHEPFPLLSDSRPDLPPAVDELLQKATAKRAADRYATALEMAADFRLAVQGDRGGRSELMPVPAAILTGVELYNPYKGLQAFQETDADDFFGRETLVERLVARMTPLSASGGKPGVASKGRFLALVGPSGSGKSSVVKAGLIPALRSGAIPGSENWFVAEMVPGTHPLEELEMALWPIAVDAPPSLVEPMQRDVRGMLRTLRRILPLEDSHEEGAQLLLFIDQFEELFTLVEDSERRNFFLDSLLAAIHAPRSPLRVVITLRADFYDRPLHYHLLGELLKENSEIVLPLIPEEIAWAVREPARRVGVGLEERLAEIIVADVAEEPGGLPLLQYALTELFERRQKGLMTRSAYEQIGGVLGALGRRAEEIYGGLSDWGKEATRQMFLRLVTLGEGSEDTRRRILRSELEGVVAPKRDGAPATNQGDNENGRMSPTEIKSQKSDSEEMSVLDLFGSARLLTFDRDPASRAPTVEVAHEALLREWRRLRHWLEQSRDEVRLHRLLGTASVEWSKAGKDDSYLLRGTRLAQFEEWSRDSSLALAQGETEFLSRSIDAREGRRSAEEARRQRELEAARKLADTEKARAEIESRRAEEQANAASRLRQRALMLGGVLIIAVGLAVAAAILGQDARRNADLAATREAEAVANAELAAEAAEAEATAAAEALQQKVVAEQERSKAEAQTLVAESRELAAASTSSLATDPELALLLAVEAVDKEDTRAANQALHLALVGSRVRQRLVGHEAAVQRLAYSPDGSLIALAAHGEELATIWDADSGQKLHEIALGRVWGVYFDEDGGQFAAVERSQSFSLGIWDTATGEKRESFPLPFAAREVVGYYLHPDWTRAALYFADGTLAIWNIRGGEQLFELPGHTSSDYVELEFSRDGSRLVSYDWPNGAVMVWDAGSGELIRQIDTGEEVNDHAVSPDGSRVALAVFKDFQGWEVQIWDVDATPADEELSAAVTLTGHAQTIRLIDFSRDGKLVASASRDGTSRIWDSETGESLLVLPHTEHVRSVVFHPDGHRLLSSDIEGVALVWDITPQGSSERLGLVAHDARMYAIDLSPDGGKLATGDDLGGLKIWDLAVQEMSQQMAGHRGSIHDIDFHPDGRRVATASADGTARVWNLANGEELFNLDGHGEGAGSGALPGVLGLDHSPDGTMIATAGNDGTVRIWDSESGQEMRVLQRSDVPLTRVAFSPDGRYLAVGHHSGAQLDMEVKETPVSIWDVETSQELFSFETSHGSGLWGLAFSPDGRFLATSGSDRMARLWRLDYGANDAELLATLSGHSGTIGVVRFSPDGRTLTTANREESRLWDLGALYDSGVGSSEMSVPELLTLPGGYGLFNDDGSELITGGVDGIVRAYLLNLEELMALARSRLTRTLSEAECRQFLHVASCTIEPAG
jgi:WD40 repeat protein/energy-coupling factor transporter ATP-binding protein EcfA2